MICGYGSSLKYNQIRSRPIEGKIIRPNAAIKLNRQIKMRSQDDESGSNDGVEKAALEKEDATVQPLQLPQSIISKLREEIFSLDTFFVTSVENYGTSGVVFSGNLRGKPDHVRAVLSSRLSKSFGAQYTIYLLENREEKPVVVVIPSEAAEFQTSENVELVLSFALSLCTIATTANVMGAELFNAALLVAKFDPEKIISALPGSIGALGILLAHEIGHLVAASKFGVKLAPPLPIPAGLGLIFSFGTITRIKSTVPNREALASVITPGPIAGYIASMSLLLAGLLLTYTGNGGVELDIESFKESLLIGALGNAVFGERLFSAVSIDCNPLFVAGWAGLIINGINCIPAGELDGAKMFLALFGRPAASSMSVFSFLALGIASFTNGLPLFWLLLVLTIQRGPIVPCQEEISGVDNVALKYAALVSLILPLLILLPYPNLISDY